MEIRLVAFAVLLIGSLSCAQAFVGNQQQQQQQQQQRQRTLNIRPSLDQGRPQFRPIVAFDSSSSLSIQRRQQQQRKPPQMSLFMELGEAWAAYNTALEENPLLVKSVTASVILGAADLTGQFVESKLKQKSDSSSSSSSGSSITSSSSSSDNTPSVDWARVARFAFFGLVLQAPWNHFYYLALDGVLPPTPEPWTATTAIKVVIDQFVQAPIFTAIIFIFLGTLEGKTKDEVQKQLQADYTDTMLANWKLWVPATVINIAFVPPILRVLYLNAVFFFWCIFLSVQLNKEQS